MAAAAHRSGPPTTATATGKIITINMINITLMIFTYHLLRVVFSVASCCSCCCFVFVIHLFIDISLIYNYIHSFISLLIQVLFVYSWFVTLFERQAMVASLTTFAK